MSKFNQGNTKASKLTGVQVMEIREKYASGQYTQDRLSREYRVTTTTIRNVVHGVTWQHLPDVQAQEAIDVDVARSIRRLEIAEPTPIAPDLIASLAADLAAAKAGTQAAETTLVEASPTVAAKAAFYTSGAKPPVEDNQETHDVPKQTREDAPKAG